MPPSGQPNHRCQSPQMSFVTSSTATDSGTRTSLRMKPMAGERAAPCMGAAVASVDEVWAAAQNSY